MLDLFSFISGIPIYIYKYSSHYPRVPFHPAILVFNIRVAWWYDERMVPRQSVGVTLGTHQDIKFNCDGS